MVIQPRGEQETPRSLEHLRAKSDATRSAANGLKAAIASNKAAASNKVPGDTHRSKMSARARSVRLQVE